MKPIKVKDDEKLGAKLWRVSIGRNISLSCNSRGATRWFSKGPNSNVALGTQSNILIKREVNFGDNGYYYCYGQYDIAGYWAKHFIARTRLKVYGKLFCILQ